VTTGWQFRVDRGGTSTDIVARCPDAPDTLLVITRGFRGIPRIAPQPSTGVPYPAEEFARRPDGAAVGCLRTARRKTDPAAYAASRLPVVEAMARRRPNTPQQAGEETNDLRAF
jgi:hypothetical protein